MPTPSRAFFIASLFLIPLLSACGRASIRFDLNPPPAALKEAPVPLAGAAHPEGDAKIAIIDVRGVILDTANPGILTPAVNPVDELLARLDRAERDPAVKAIILRINSPGGSVSASDTMYRELASFRERTGKPIVASMGEVAASGGYYIALAADTIIAQPTTITGSIGVIMPTVNVSGGLAKIGIVSRAVKSGENKDLANPLEPMREEQYAILQGMVEEFYERFAGLVVERRGHRARSASEGNYGPTDPAPHHTLVSHPAEVMDGRVFTGESALRAGLVDHTGGLREVFAHAKSLAGLHDTTRVRLIKYYDDVTGGMPRTAYAQGPVDSPQARGGSEINLVQVRLGDGSIAGLNAGAGAYYLWTMP